MRRRGERGTKITKQAKRVKEKGRAGPKEAEEGKPAMQKPREWGNESRYNVFEQMNSGPVGDLGVLVSCP